MQLRAIKEVVRIINAREKEEEYATKKYQYRKEFIDIEVRNVFKTGKVTTSMIKYAHRFNHYGMREVIIINNMVEATFSRCEKFKHRIM